MQGKGGKSRRSIRCYPSYAWAWCRLATLFRAMIVLAEIISSPLFLHYSYELELHPQRKVKSSANLQTLDMSRQICLCCRSMTGAWQSLRNGRINFILCLAGLPSSRNDPRIRSEHRIIVFVFVSQPKSHFCHSYIMIGLPETLFNYPLHLIFLLLLLSCASLGLCGFSSDHRCDCTTPASYLYSNLISICLSDSTTCV